MKLNIAAKKIGAAVLGLAICASVAAVAVQKASAHGDNKGNKLGFGANLEAKLGAKLGLFNRVKEVKKDARMQPQVVISANGRVLVRGAEVTAISGETINAEASWGSYESAWEVDASEAKFIRHQGGEAEFADISIGDTISFSGALDTNESNATVEADFVKEWSVDLD